MLVGLLPTGLLPDSASRFLWQGGLRYGTMSGRERFPTLRLILLGSEPATRQDVALYRQHFPPSCILTAGTGATEMTPFTRYFVDHGVSVPESVVPTGYACFEDVEVLVLHDDGREAEVDCTGEIVVCSRYLSPGYWRDPELTQTKFQPDPCGNNLRRYHTGDLGRRRDDGCLIALGRQDVQVKIRGLRVEIAEIEAGLLRCDGVQETAVVAQEGPHGQPYLVGYIVPHSGTRPTPGDLRRTLRRSLPAHMVPTAFMVMEALPQTVTGKVDWRHQPSPTWQWFSISIRPRKLSLRPWPVCWPR